MLCGQSADEVDLGTDSELRAEGVDQGWGEPLVDGAVAPPQQERELLHLGLPGRPDPGVVGRVIGYEPLRDRCLESQHVEALEPLCGTPDYRPVGAAWTPHHGVVGPGC